MKLCYVINQYPKESHTFIRREIDELESRGCSVLRIAVKRPKGTFVDPNDEQEVGRTKYLLDRWQLNFALSLLSMCLRNPRGVSRAATITFKLIFGKTDRSPARHIITFFEACLVAYLVRKAFVQHIHAHFGTNSAEVAMLASIIAGVCYSFTIHGPDEFDAPRFNGLALKIQHAKFVIAISHYTRSQVLRWINYSEWNKVRVVYCGVSELSDNSLPRRPNQLVCVGRLAEQKGHGILIDAFNDALRKGIDLTLLIVGDGSLRNQIESKVSFYGLQDRVLFAGWLSNQEVNAVITESRATILASFAEGLPIVTMESFAARRPVITTNIAGIAELVRHKENGWLCTPGDFISLSNAIYDCSTKNLGDVVEMGRKGKVLATNQHNLQVQVDKLYGLFSHFDAQS